METDTKVPAGTGGCSLDSLVGLRDRLRLAWHNWRVRGIAKAYRALTQAMRDDPDYAHSWQCNIAMPIYDGAKGKLTIEEANIIADNLMRHLFEVKKSNAGTERRREQPERTDNG